MDIYSIWKWQKVNWFPLKRQSEMLSCVAVMTLKSLAFKCVPCTSCRNGLLLLCLQIMQHICRPNALLNRPIISIKSDSIPLRETPVQISHKANINYLTKWGDGMGRESYIFSCCPKSAFILSYLFLDTKAFVHVRNKREGVCAFCLESWTKA